MTRRKTFTADCSVEDLLVPVFRAGRLVYAPPPLDEVRRHFREQLAGFHGGIKPFVNPHQYPVGLEKGLHDLRLELILKARGHAPGDA